MSLTFDLVWVSPKTHQLCHIEGGLKCYVDGITLTSLSMTFLIIKACKNRSRSLFFKLVHHCHKMHQLCHIEGGSDHYGLRNRLDKSETSRQTFKLTDRPTNIHMLYILYVPSNPFGSGDKNCGDCYIILEVWDYIFLKMCNLCKNICHIHSMLMHYYLITIGNSSHSKNMCHVSACSIHSILGMSTHTESLWKNTRNCWLGQT